MKTKKIKVTVSLRPGILDAEGVTIQRNVATRAGFPEVADVRVGKVFVVDWHGPLTTKAKKKVEQLALTVLSNPIMQVYQIDWPS